MSPPQATVSARPDTRVATPDASAPRVLIADDEETLRDACTDILACQGYDVTTAADGMSAATIIGEAEFDVIVSDIHMPGLDGIALLRKVRERHLDVPVILMTGDPALETAMKAVEYGAMRYLVKPFRVAELQQVVVEATRLHRLAKVRREVMELLGGNSPAIDDRAGLEASFERALKTLKMAFQPIVSWSRRRAVGYEALARPQEPSLPHPGALFTAAERLGRLGDVGRLIRSIVAQRSGEVPADARIFLNVHPRDLMDDALYQPQAPLSLVAKRIVLEITERASLHEVRELRKRIASLREMGFKIAIDDLGAGYAGLNCFAQLEPEVIKLDGTLVRYVDREPTKQRLVRALIDLSREMGHVVIAECVETPEERDTLIALGCDLLQGYLFGRPELTIGELRCWDATP